MRRSQSGATWLAIASIVIAHASGSAQQPQTRDASHPPIRGTASIAGTIVADDDAHAPIRHATVTIRSAGRLDMRMTATDESGRYLFRDLPAATYTMDAAKGAYLATSYGALRPGGADLGVPIPLAEGQAFVARPMVLTRGSVVTGRLLDANGRPVAGVGVTVGLLTIVNGDRQVRPMNGAVTDSRGIYRVFGLVPGDYLISATAPLLSGPMATLTTAQLQWLDRGSGAGAVPPPPSSRPLIPVPTFYPGTADVAAAGVVTLGRGEERADLDIALVRVGAANISGIVSGADGQPFANAIVARAPKKIGSLTGSALNLQTRSALDGSFSMIGVAPGEYAVVARAAGTPGTTTRSTGDLNMPTGALTLWAQMDVSMNGDDIAGLELRLQPGMIISGTVQFEGTAPAPTDLAGYRPTIAAVDRTLPTIAVTNSTAAPAASDRTFKLEGVAPGAYWLSAPHDEPVVAGQPPVWMLKSITRDSTDVLSTPFEVRPREDVTDVVVAYTDRHTQLDGRFIDTAGQPASQYTVVAFTTNHTIWSMPSRQLMRWVASARAGVDGSFHVMGLPPGDYFVCALTAGANAPVFDAAFFDSIIAQSIRITLADGATLTQTFRVGG